MSDLKPCPFCGGEVNIVYTKTLHAYLIFPKSDNGCKYIAVISANNAKTISEAIDMWNKRI